MSKGRNKRLISLRDETLIRRYYYWTEIERRRFDDALKILSEQEFFISEARIMAIIRQNCDKLTDIEVKPADQRPSTHALPRWIASIRPVLHP